MMSNNLHHYYHLLATIAVLGALFSSILITTAYAQPKQRGPCPEGFELNRGVCQAEPELSCDPLGYPPQRIELTEDGECKIQHTNSPYCVQGYYDIWDNQCEDPVSFDGKFATENQEMYCSEEGFGGELIQSENTGNRWQCVIYEFEPAVQVCDEGELNEESGMCEVRPGRGNR